MPVRSKGLCCLQAGVPVWCTLLLDTEHPVSEPASHYQNDPCLSCFTDWVEMRLVLQGPDGPSLLHPVLKPLSGHENQDGRAGGWVDRGSEGCRTELFALPTNLPFVFIMG